LIAFLNISLKVRKFERKCGVWRYYYNKSVESGAITTTIDTIPMYSYEIFFGMIPSVEVPTEYKFYCVV
jgi:hypothetical protein